VSTRLGLILGQSAARGSPGCSRAGWAVDVRIRVEPSASLEGPVGAGLTQAEQAWVSGRALPHLHVASTRLGRAIVEDALRALGIETPRVEIVRDDAGAPTAVLAEETLRAARSRGVTGVIVSLAHGPGLIAAVALPLRVARPTSDGTDPATVLGALGVGIDVVSRKEIEEILDYPNRALKRVFTAEELRSAEGPGRRDAVSRLAMLLAAKEASFKALGPVLRSIRQPDRAGSSSDLAADFRDIEIVGLDTDAPTGVPRGALARLIRDPHRLDALRVVVAEDRGLVGVLALCTSSRTT
jgi:phosphopantetheine--protein transferase-like protein